MTEPTRQLPGVKGQWILAADCRPSHEEADDDGDVHVYDGNYNGAAYAEYQSVFPDQYWRPGDKNDPRPFTLPAAPAPEQAAAGARLFDKLTGNADGRSLWAVADDGTAWERTSTSRSSLSWRQLPPLPDREV
jgi:hypothetical protein